MNGTATSIPASCCRRSCPQDRIGIRPGSVERKEKASVHRHLASCPSCQSWAMAMKLPEMVGLIEGSSPDSIAGALSSGGGGESARHIPVAPRASPSGASRRRFMERSWSWRSGVKSRAVLRIHEPESTLSGRNPNSSPAALRDRGAGGRGSGPGRWRRPPGGRAGIHRPVPWPPAAARLCGPPA